LIARQIGQKQDEATASSCLMVATALVVCMHLNLPLNITEKLTYVLTLCKQVCYILVEQLNLIQLYTMTD